MNEPIAEKGAPPNVLLTEDDSAEKDRPRRVVPRWWCRLTFRHRGRVGYILHSGPYWMCDTCGTVLR